MDVTAGHSSGPHGCNLADAAPALSAMPSAIYGRSRGDHLVRVVPVTTLPGGEDMRTLLRVIVDTEAGNRAILDGSLPKIVGQFVEKTKPEAAYFGPHNGKRSATFVFDMQDSSQLPALVEPFFIGLGADIEIFPVMNLEDLQKGLAAVER
jgi:hypothetical protein